MAIDTLRAYAFLGEPIKIEHTDEKRKISNRDIPRPSGLTDPQAAIACALLCHGMRFKIEKFLPLGTPVEIIDCGFATGEDPQASWGSEIMLEIGDGWTIAPTVETSHGYRGAIRWHAYDPEGDAIAENVAELEAVCAIVSAVAAYTVEKLYTSHQ